MEDSSLDIVLHLLKLLKTGQLGSSRPNESKSNESGHRAIGSDIFPISLTKIPSKHLELIIGIHDKISPCQYYGFKLNIMYSTYCNINMITIICNGVFV